MNIVSAHLVLKVTITNSNIFVQNIVAYSVRSPYKANSCLDCHYKYMCVKMQFGYPFQSRDCLISSMRVG